MTLIIETEVPGWMKWVAQAEDGAWYAYEEQPYPEDGDWFPRWEFSHIDKWIQIGDSGKSNSKWRDTLRKIEDIKVGLIIETEIPNWVKWVAQDEDGYWNAYEKKPSAECHSWISTIDPDSGKWIQIGDSGKSNSKWRDTLRKIEDIKVSLIIETEIPNWVKWVAQEENGDWYAYEKEPTAECHSWGQDLGVSGKWIQIGSSEKPNPKWRDTLHKIEVKP